MTAATPTPGASATRGARYRTMAGVAFVTTSLVFLHRIGTGDLAPPPLGGPGAVGDWLGHHDPVTATFALLRLVGLGAGWYLVGATGLQVAARLTRLRSLSIIADLLSTPAVRQAASGLLGFTLSMHVVGSSDEARPDARTLERVVDADGAAVLRRLGDTEVIVAIPDDEGDTAIMERLPEAEPEPDRPAPTSASITVECGDHPWSIAESALADAWGRPPTDAEIDPYWRELLALNHFPDPDLVFNGQVLQLPPTPASPA